MSSKVTAAKANFCLIIIDPWPGRNRLSTVNSKTEEPTPHACPPKWLCRKGGQANSWGCSAPPSHTALPVLLPMVYNLLPFFILLHRDQGSAPGTSPCFRLDGCLCVAMHGCLCGLTSVRQCYRRQLLNRPGARNSPPPPYSSALRSTTARVPLEINSPLPFCQGLNLLLFFRKVYL